MPFTEIDKIGNSFNLPAMLFHLQFLNESGSILLNTSNFKSSLWRISNPHHFDAFLIAIADETAFNLPADVFSRLIQIILL